MNDQEQTIVRESPWKNWTIFLLVLYAGFLTWWHITKTKDIILEISGLQILLILIVLGVFAYVFILQRQKKTLPDAGTIIQELREWQATHKPEEEIPDTSDYEILRSSDFEAYVYLPRVGKTYTYNADKGVVEVNNRDLEMTLRRVEEHEIIRKYFTNTRTKEKTTTTLEKRGYEVQE